MPALNPNHPITQQMSDSDTQQKLMAILVMKLGGNVEITTDDIRELNALFRGEAPVLVHWSHDTTLELKLLPMSEGLQLARENGGLPC
jgi:hypothetical protein